MTLLVKHIYDEEQLKRALNDNFLRGYVQVKINGVYCEVRSNPRGEMTFTSRQGKPLNITKANLPIEQWEELIKMTSDDLTVVGELTVLGYLNNFHWSSGEVRKKEPTAQLQFSGFACYVNGYEGFNDIRKLEEQYPYILNNTTKWHAMSFISKARDAGGIEQLRRLMGVEGFVYYTTPDGNFTPDKRTDQVIAYKPVIKFNATLQSVSYNTTVRGDIITSVNVIREDNKVATLGSGIDDNLRNLIEQLSPSQYGELTLECEALDISENDVYQQPRIKGYKFSGTIVPLVVPKLMNDE